MIIATGEAAYGVRYVVKGRSTKGMVVLSDAAEFKANASERGDGGVREVNSAARTVELLELLAARRHQPMKLRELSEQLGAPRSSIYALIRTLVDRGRVRTDPTGTLQSIGIQALLAGTTYLDVDPILRLVQPQVSNLSMQPTASRGSPTHLPETLTRLTPHTVVDRAELQAQLEQTQIRATQRTARRTCPAPSATPSS